MVGLAIHTCGSGLGLARRDGAGRTRHQTWAIGRDLSRYLHLHLAEFMADCDWSAVAFLAVAQGPGGFTGTRLGVVTARTLAQQLAVPLFGVSSLAALAQRAASAAGRGQDLAVAMPAQRGQLYTAIYRPTAPGLEAIQPDRVRSPADWETVLQAHPCRRIAAEEPLEETVVQVLELAHDRWQRGDRPAWEAVLPYYGQHPVER